MNLSKTRPLTAAAITLAAAILATAVCAAAPARSAEPAPHVADTYSPDAV